MQPLEYRSVSYWSKEINGTLPGGRKNLIFLIREIDDAAMAAASVESCRLAAQKPSGSRFGSVLDMCNRLRRLRRRFQINIHLPALYLYWP